MRQSVRWWAVALLVALGAPAWPQPVQMAHRWSEEGLLYLGELTGHGQMPVPLLDEQGAWRQVPFELNASLELRLRPLRVHPEYTDLELQPTLPRLRLVWPQEEQNLKVALISLRLQVTPRGGVRSSEPVNPREQVEIPATLFDLPLDYFSLFYPLLFPLLPPGPADVNDEWLEEGMMPMASAPDARMQVRHHFARWEQRGEIGCVRLESTWETPSLRESFQIGARPFFLRTRWQGKAITWFDPGEGIVRAAEAPVAGTLALQFLLPDGTLFDGEATLSLTYRLRLAERPVGEPAPLGAAVASDERSGVDAGLTNED